MDVASDVELVDSAINEVKESKRLRGLFQYILAIGNYMNRAYFGGQSKGFKLTSILMVYRIPSFSSFLINGSHYLLLVLYLLYASLLIWNPTITLPVYWNTSFIYWTMLDIRIYWYSEKKCPTLRTVLKVIPIYQMHSYNRSITSISIINCPFPHISLLTNNIDRVSSVNEELEELKKGIKLIEEMLNKHKPEEGQEEDTFLNTMRISFPLFIII